jgi:hypothetical protein
MSTSFGKHLHQVVRLLLLLENGGGSVILLEKMLVEFMLIDGRLAEWYERA